MITFRLLLTLVLLNWNIPDICVETTELECQPRITNSFNLTQMSGEWYIVLYVKQNISHALRVYRHDILVRHDLVSVRLATWYRNEEGQYVCSDIMLSSPNGGSNSLELTTQDANATKKLKLDYRLVDTDYTTYATVVGCQIENTQQRVDCALPFLWILSRKNVMNKAYLLEVKKSLKRMCLLKETLMQTPFIKDCTDSISTTNQTPVSNYSVFRHKEDRRLHVLYSHGAPCLLAKLNVSVCISYLTLEKKLHMSTFDSPNVSGECLTDSSLGYLTFDWLEHSIQLHMIFVKNEWMWFVSKITLSYNLSAFTTQPTPIQSGERNVLLTTDLFQTPLNFAYKCETEIRIELTPHQLLKHPVMFSGVVLQTTGVRGDDFGECILCARDVAIADRVHELTIVAGVMISFMILFTTIATYAILKTSYCHKDYVRIPDKTCAETG